MSTIPHSVCLVEGCSQKHVARGYCSRHYDKMRRSGQLNPLPKDPLKYHYPPGLSSKEKKAFRAATIRATETSEERQARLEYHRDYNLNNKEKLKEHSKAYREANRTNILKKKSEYYHENREEILRCQAVYRKDNPDAIKARRKSDYENNSDRYKSEAKQWRKANPARARENGRRGKKRHPEWARKQSRIRRARRKAVQTEAWSEEDIINRYGSDCHLCLYPIDLDAPRSPKFLNWELGFHPDHYTPMSKGGSDLLVNLRPSHAWCNYKKGARTMDELNLPDFHEFMAKFF